MSVISCVTRSCSWSEIAVTDTARGLARHVLAPRGSWPLRPFLALARLPAVGLLPPAIRHAYGFEWTGRQERRLAMLSAVVRHALPIASPLLRHWPAARRAETRTAG